MAGGRTAHRPSVIMRAMRDEEEQAFREMHEHDEGERRKQLESILARKRKAHTKHGKHHHHHHHGGGGGHHEQQRSEPRTLARASSFHGGAPGGAAADGFAADGFPVFGSCISESGAIRNVKSSYQLKDDGGPRQAVTGYTTPSAGTGNIASSNYDGQFRGDYEYVAGAGDLDECNGMTVDGQYGYYISDSFPWVLNCFSGTPDSSFGS